jgi:hypothetical protein
MAQCPTRVASWHGEHRCNFYSVPDATRRQAIELHTPAEEARVFGDAVGRPSGAREPSMSALTELMPATVDRIRPDLARLEDAGSSRPGPAMPTVFADIAQRAGC